MDPEAERGAPTSSTACTGTTARATDTVCFSSGGVAIYFFIRGQPIATTPGFTYIDESAPATATYRIGVGTNWIDDPEAGDVFAFSLPVAVGG